MSQVCRLCLTHYENGSVLTKITPETLKSQIEVILPEINLDIIKCPMICENCSKLLTSAYTFKNLCIDNEVRIQTLLNNCLMVDVTLDELLAESESLKPQDPIEIIVYGGEQNMGTQNMSYNIANNYTTTPVNQNNSVQKTQYLVFKEPQVFVQANLEIPESKTAERYVKCSYCLKQLLRMKHLKWHQRLITNEVLVPMDVPMDGKYHQCELCEIKTLCPGKFQIHMDTHMDDPDGRGIKRKYCESCDLQFVQEADFETHMSQHKTCPVEYLAVDGTNEEEILPT